MESRGEKPFEVILPDQKPINVLNEVEVKIVEGIMAVSAEFPATGSELGTFVYDRPLDPQLEFQLTSHIGVINSILQPHEWTILRGSQGIWLERVTPKKDPAQQRTDLITGEADTTLSIKSMLLPLHSEGFELLYAESPDVCEASMARIQRNAELLENGELETPTGLQILEASTSREKINLAVKTLESLIALSVLDPNNLSVRNIYGWGTRLNEIKLFLGGGAMGNEALAEAIDSLDEV